MTVDRERLLELIGHVAGRSADQISADARLVEDLGFDSLMLTELTVFLLEAGAISDDLPADITWEGLTVEDLAVGRLSRPAVSASTLSRYQGSESRRS
jgi:acyl carrier protein